MTDDLKIPKKRNVHSYKTELAVALEDGRRWMLAADQYQAERDEARIDADHQRALVRQWQEDSAKWYRAFKATLTWAGIVVSVLLVALIVALA